MQEGTPGPLEVSYAAEDAAYNFALYSKHATGVRLLLYREGDAVNPVHAYDFDPRINKSGRVWHCRVPSSIVESSSYYAYQVDGPHKPSAGHRFDPQKVLLDPYARGIFFPPQFSRDAARHRGANAGRAPLGIIRPAGALEINKLSCTDENRRSVSNTPGTIIGSESVTHSDVFGYIYRYDVSQVLDDV